LKTKKTTLLKSKQQINGQKLSRKHDIIALEIIVEPS